MKRFSIVLLTSFVAIEFLVGISPTFAAKPIIGISAEIILEVTQADLVAGRTQPIELPPGFRTVTVSVRALDFDKVANLTFFVGFGSSSLTPQDTVLGPLLLFRHNVPVETRGSFSGTQIPDNKNATYQIGGSAIQFQIDGRATGGGTAPSDAVYQIYLYLSE